MARSFTVDITTEGRSGHVHYAEGPLRTCSFYWEFGGGDVVASINVPSPFNWDAEIPWAASRRDEVLQRIAQEVQQKQCPSCEARISDNWIEVLQH